MTRVSMVREPARIAYLVKRFPRLSETFILDEILQLQQTGIDLRLYALMDPEEKQVQPQAAALQPQVVYLYGRRRLASVVRLLTGAARQAVRRPVGAARVLWALMSVHRSMPSLRHAVEGMWLAGDLQRRGVSHLHAHFIHSPAAVAFFARLAGGPHFSVTAHAKDLYTTLPRNIRIRADAADFLVTCTQANAGYLRQLVSTPAAARIRVLHHGVDLQRFIPATPAEVGHILSVGRLVPKKGFADLITAFDLLNREGHRFDAEILGGGPLHDQLVHQVEAAGLGHRVKFRGARTQDSVIEAFRRACLFVLAPVITDSGDRDGIPNVLVEAMASGLPVITTRVSGIPELISDGRDGIMVEPHDPPALAAAMARLLSDRELAERLGVAARRKVERLFDIHTAIRELHRLFTADTRFRALAAGDAERLAA